MSSAVEDRWSYPHAEELGVRHASPFDRPLGVEGQSAEAMPDIEQPVLRRVAYRIRSGKYDLTRYDWECYLNFPDRYL